MQEQVGAQGEWRERERAHHERVDALAAGHLDRRERGVKHPVEDFLWVYYRHRPGQLRRWHPGPGVFLEGDHDPAGRASWRHYEATPAGTRLDVGGYLARRGETVRWVSDLLTATAGRAPTLSCFGLHEWAMVYKIPDGARRHEQLPLRLGRARTDAVVEASQLRCSHFDAFRFFTPEGAPRNLLNPTRETQIEAEQPGCLHATMDLYKWCFKLAPGIPSDLTMACLDLARRARMLDMRASPYDLTAFDLTPVEIESAEGRALYVAHQRDIVTAGTHLREQLMNACRALLSGA